MNQSILLGVSISLVLLALIAWIRPAEVMTPPTNTRNVLGTKLEMCSTSPLTGFYRDGYCNTGRDDYGTHVVCAEMTQEFLDFTKAKGNDLCTARPEYRFPGLKTGNKWCLCALRWKEAYEAGYAPKVVLESTNEKALKYVTLEELK